MHSGQFCILHDEIVKAFGQTVFLIEQSLYTLFEISPLSLELNLKFLDLNICIIKAGL